MDLGRDARPPPPRMLWSPREWPFVDLGCRAKSVPMLAGQELEPPPRRLHEHRYKKWATDRKTASGKSRMPWTKLNDAPALLVCALDSDECRAWARVKTKPLRSHQRSSRSNHWHKVSSSPRWATAALTTRCGALERNTASKGFVNSSKTSRGRRPVWSRRRGSQPAARRRCKDSTWKQSSSVLQAACNGVRPSARAKVESAPWLSNIDTISGHPFPAAACRGASKPSSLTALGCARACKSSRTATMPSGKHPKLWIARSKGRRPRHGTSMLSGSCAKRNCNAGMCARRIASWMAWLPLQSGSWFRINVIDKSGTEHHSMAIRRSASKCLSSRRKFGAPGGVSI